MVASRQVEIPYHRGVGRQREMVLALLHKLLGELQFPFLRKYVVPAAKGIGADMLDFAMPEIAEVVGARKNFKTAAKSVGKKTLKQQLGEGKGTAGGRPVNRGKSFQQNLLHTPVGREETFLKTFLVDHVKQQFSVPIFCGSVWKSWRESPNCCRCPVLA